MSIIFHCLMSIISYPSMSMLFVSIHQPFFVSIQVTLIPMLFVSIQTLSLRIHQPLSPSYRSMRDRYEMLSQTISTIASYPCSTLIFAPIPNILVRSYDFVTIKSISIPRIDPSFASSYPSATPLFVSIPSVAFRIE